MNLGAEVNIIEAKRVLSSASARLLGEFIVRLVQHRV